jgi:capsular exopolysaccharide synthesis family protein
MDLPAIASPERVFAPPHLEPSARSPLEVLRRRSLLFFVTAVSFTLLVAAALMLSPKTYTAHVKFIAGSAAAPAAPGAGGQTILPVLNAILDASGAQSSETYAEMLRQTPAVERAIATEHLSLTARQLLDRVKVKPVTNTSILDVGVAWSDPQHAAQIANALADAFVDVRRELIAGQADSAAHFIGDQLPNARRDMSRSAAALATYQSRNELADADQQTQALLGTLADTDRKMATIEVDGKQANAQLAVVRQQLAHTTQTISGGRQVAPNPAVSQLQTQLAQVDVQLKSALSQYTDEHPTVRTLRAQDAQIRRELAGAPATIIAADTTVVNPVRQALTQTAATLASQIASDAAQLGVLRQQRERTRPQLRELPRRIAQLVALKRQAKQDQDVYDALQQKLEQARIARTTTLSDVAVIARASAADVQVSPNVVVDMAIGLLLAMFIGLAVVFVVEKFDESLRTEQDVVERLALPVLSAIPRLPERASRPEWLEAATVDAYLQLVTALRYASSERLTAIAFTSAEPEGGKSHVAFHTAVALAELTPRVLLVDADLRLPSLHARCGMRRSAGLSDYLVGTLGFDDAVRATKHAGLDIVCAGTSVPNPYALLQSAAFDTFLGEARRRYEVVIVDTPACAAVIDTAVVCTRVDGTVFVVASKETHATQAERGLARLRSAGVRNVIGAVLNKVAPERTVIGPYGFRGSEQHALPPARARDERSA